MYASIPARYREEQVFIREIWFEPTDLSARLIYADWLEEHGDVRAQILRNDIEFIDLAAANLSENKTQAEQERLVEKRRTLLKPDHFEWVALIGSCPIENCQAIGARMDPAPEQEFRLRCPMRWENLQPIGDDAKVRFCSECGRSVHYCWTMLDAESHRRHGNCVAIDPWVNRHYDYETYDTYQTIEDVDLI